MAGLDPAIHVLGMPRRKDVDTRHKAGHDEHRGKFKAVAGPDITHIATLVQPIRSETRRRRIARVALAVLYIAFGGLHLAAADRFLPIMPGWVPFPREVVLFTGVCEIAGGLGLLFQRTRVLAGVMLALYAVAVYPANLHHAIANVHVPGLPSTWWYHAPRLAFQPVFVWWALWAGGVVGWPFAAAQKEGRT